MKFNFLAFLFLSFTACSSANDKSIAERADKDEIVMVADDDADMDIAFARAKEGLDQFLSAWNSQPPGTAGYSVKVGVKEGETTEYFWISAIREESGSFFGVVSNTPQLVSNVTEGEEIQFKKVDIVDWTYTKDGKMVGNFTACAMLKKESEASRREFRDAYGLECEA